jgi:ABC-type nitrate/sulfonate/bicarbonate transport system substrate-binding protein
MITNKPTVVQAFVNATFRAMRFFKQNKSEAIKLLATYQKRDESSAQRVYALDVDNFAGDGSLKCDSVNRQFELEKVFLRIDAAPHCDLVVDNRFAQRIPTR